ncbi:MAG TPA: Smr/MutS family protein [Geobacteraceae bacterium]|nr:Smr/MutS family protein [Geobacteraceae bacterium]
MIKEETLQSLEFDKILHAVAGYVKSDAAQDAVMALRPLDGRVDIERRFGEVEEVRRLGQTGVSLPLSPYRDIIPLLEAVRPDGAIIDPRDVVQIVPVLRVMTAIARQFAYRTDIPLLKEVAGHVTGFPDLLDPLEASLDEEGNILDTASRLLLELRTRKRGLTARIRKRLEEIVREKRTAIFLQDDFITQRAGRWVIPVRMDSKGMVAGVVHDVSNSGETAFMEPLEIIGLANELENLTAEEKAEQIRILRELCGWIREDADRIEQQFRAVVHLDLVNSIASFADLLEAETPGINDTGEIRLKEARHPILLLLRRERGGKEIVPLDLVLGEQTSGEPVADADFFAGQGGKEEATEAYPEVRRGADDAANAGMRKKPHRQNRIMVITGPNAGGKTIALKTTGLLLVMALTGMPVPAAGTSTFPLTDELLVDIGDEQSIEASLSTFSAHVANIAGILQRAGRRTLVLMDELGTGTEPGQGAAIACAVLHELLVQGALVVATTHLTDIIGFVHKTPGMVNAAMEFDRNALTPLYRLKAGEPGQSHAIEIAQRFGLPERVIEFARGMVSRLESDFHELLAELKEQRQRHEEALLDLEFRSRELAEKEQRAAERLADAERQRRESLEKGWQEAKEVIQGARREVNAIIDEARRERSRAAQERLREAEEAADARLRELRPETQLAIEEIAEGNTVFVKPIGYDAIVTAVDRKHGRLRVRAGLMEIEVFPSDLAPRTGKKPLAGKARRQAEEKAVPSRELNIIGLRVDDALPELERFLNQVSLEGIGEVRIIHGKGTGALMRAVRDYLADHPLVREFRKGEPLEGGEGATVVTLR